MAARLERTVLPTAAEEFTLKRWAAHGYETDADALGDTGDWSRAVVDVTKHQGLASLSGFPFRTSSSLAYQARLCHYRQRG